MSNPQPNWCLKIDFQKVDQHAGGKSLASCMLVHLLEIDGTMLNPIFWKKGYG